MLWYCPRCSWTSQFSELFGPHCPRCSTYGNLSLLSVLFDCGDVRLRIIPEEV